MIGVATIAAGLIIGVGFVVVVWHIVGRLTDGRTGIGAGSVAALIAGASLVASPPSPAPTTSDATALVSQSTVVRYGSGIGADSLANTQVGGSLETRVSYRFRAATSSKLSKIRIYLEDGSGYSGGNGGRLKISVVKDSGTGGHGPIGTALASVTIRPGNPVTIGHLPIITFPSPASLVAGRLYHVMFSNIDPSPKSNFTSVNALFTHEVDQPRQPGISDLDWGQMNDKGDGWRIANRFTPILDLTYADGTHDGIGYMEVWVNAAKTISGSRSAREAFTIRGSNRTVSSVAIRLNRVSGSSPLTVRVQTSGGRLIEKGTIAASSIPIAARASWVTYDFTTARTLVAGQAYHLVLSTASDTSYSIFVIRKGVEYGFSSATYFADGTGQYNSGSGWVGFDPGWSGPSSQGDLQFYFR